MVLETTECINIINKGRSYTDCMEFSLLRFIQLIGYCPDEINRDGCSKYSSKVDYGLVSDFIKDHQIIYPQAKYYTDINLPGTKERADWAEFVSDRNFLDYYRNDTAELFTSVTNIIKFFNGFYSMNLDLTDHTSSLDKIAEFFSNVDKKIKIILNKVKTKEELLPMNIIHRIISRPDNEVKPSNIKHKIVIIETEIDFIINGIDYRWNLNEIYFKDNVYSNNYITGHSVINKNEMCLQIDNYV